MAPVTACQEGDAIRSVSEDVEDSWPRCYRRLGQVLLDPSLELRLPVEFLEGRYGRDEAVPVRLDLGRKLSKTAIPAEVNPSLDPGPKRRSGDVFATAIRPGLQGNGSWTAQRWPS